MNYWSCCALRFILLSAQRLCLQVLIFTTGDRGCEELAQLGVQGEALWAAPGPHGPYNAFGKLTGCAQPSFCMQTAILCCTDFFRILRDGILPYLDMGGPQQPQSSLLLQLLLKASSNDKRFVVEEAQRALQVLAESLDPSQLLNRLMPYTAHRNPKASHAQQMPLPVTKPSASQDNHRKKAHCAFCYNMLMKHLLCNPAQQQFLS